jgi:predicted component of type VI protein secretion system
MTSEPGEIRERVVEVDRKTQIKLRALEVKAERAKYQAAVAKSRAEAKDAAQAQRFQAKLELAKLRVRMTARESASKHIAVFGPFYLLLLVGAFLFAINYIPESQISVVSALLTLLVTSIAANLRSIVAGEGNGHEDDEDKPKPKSQARRPDDLGR